MRRLTADARSNSLDEGSLVGGAVGNGVLPDPAAVLNRRFQDPLGVCIHVLHDAGARFSQVCQGLAEQPAKFFINLVQK